MSRKILATILVAAGSLSALPVSAQELGSVTAFAAQESVPAGRSISVASPLAGTALTSSRQELARELAAGSGAAGRAPRWQASAAAATPDAAGLTVAVSSVLAPAAPAVGGSVTQLGFAPMDSRAALDAR